MAKVKLIVEMDIPEASKAEIRKYVTDAIISYGGGFDKSDPFFNPEDGAIKVRYHRPRQPAPQQQLPLIIYHL